MRWSWAFVGAATLTVAVAASSGTFHGATAPALTPVSSHTPAGYATQAKTQASGPSVQDPDSVIQNYCVECHNDQMKTGGLTFESFAIAQTADKAPMAERMVRKLRAGMMPPPGNTPPDAASYLGLINALETRLDAAAAAHPNPGGRTFQRLNRSEYASSIHELLGLQVNSGDWLPLDSMSANFDNIADEQILSAT